jgi:glucose-specific phosphotransferase system IIA component
MFFFKKKSEKIEITDIDKEQLYAPVAGKLIPLEQVEDVVFSQKIMGDGIAIEPAEGMLYAPMQGMISVVFPTKHVIGIEAENGANIIIHVGIDTVELNGTGFDVRVKQGDKVKPGDLLMKMDLSILRKKHAATTMVCIENTNDFQFRYTNQTEVKAGEALIKLERA